MKLTAAIEQDAQGWYVGQIEEFPAAISQGKSTAEVKTNLLDALDPLLEVNQQATENAYQGKQVIRKELEIAS